MTKYHHMSVIKEERKWDRDKYTGVQPESEN